MKRILTDPRQLVIMVDQRCAERSPIPGASASPSQVPPGFFFGIDSPVIEPRRLKDSRTQP